MNKLSLLRPVIGAILVAAAIGVTAPSASAAVANEAPIWIFEPIPPENPIFTPTLPPPTGYLSGPCGAAVDSGGNFYISDYYHDNVDVWNGHLDYSYKEGEKPPLGGFGYITSLQHEEPVDGPCAIAMDASNNLYVNNYHRNVVKYGTLSSFGEGTVIAGQGADSTHLTGLDVDPTGEVLYVNARTYIAAYHLDGTPVMNGLEPLRIGVDHLENAYGVAYSRYPGTLGRLYVPDAGSNTIKVFNPAISKTNPVEVIDGSETPNGRFVSLRDAAIAIDRVSGEIYVVDDLQPKYTERPNAVVYVFKPNGEYEGHLQDNVGDAMPVGLAVDNSGEERDPAGTQGRVYVTTGNTQPAAIYAYHPDAATTEPFSPSGYALSVSTAGLGAGSVRNGVTGEACANSCEESVPGGTVITLTANPGSDSEFSGWSGACSGEERSCTVTMEGAVSAQAHFDPVPSSATGAGQTAGAAPADASGAAQYPAQTTQVVKPRHRRHHRAHRRGHHRRAGHHRSN